MKINLYSISKFYAKKALLALGLLLCITQSLQAKITQSIDRMDIHAGESFQLTIQVDEDTGAEPDLSLIPKDFTVLSNSQYQQMSYINGNSSTIKGWKIKLSTLKTGPIILPSITVGKESTKAIALVIKDTSDRVDVSGQKKAIFLEASVDHKKVYVQQQVLFTVKLYRAVNTHYARLSEPSAGDSIIEKLGEDVQYDKTIGGTRYVVTERRYSIFPQKSGTLTLESINFTADVNDPNSQGRNRFLNTTRPISVNSKAIELIVAPQPTTAATPWVPSSKVKLTAQWTPATEKLTVGEPITWTIKLSAQGLSEAQLPEISIPKVDGLQFYPDTPQKEREINQQGILGEKIEKLAVIPSKAGTVTIPKFELKWWDTKSNSEKIASLPARTFKVIASAAAKTKANNQIDIAPNKTTVNTQNTLPSYWRNAAIIFAVLWLLTLLGYLKKRSVLAQLSSDSSSVSEIKNPSTNSRPAMQSSVRKQPVNYQKKIAPLTETQVFKRLLAAIKSQQAEDIETELLKWVFLISSMPIHSVGALAHLIENQDIKSKLQSLEAYRYSAAKNGLNIELNKADLELIAESLLVKEDDHNGDTIPPLY